MIKVTELKLPIDHLEAALKDKLIKCLKLHKGISFSYEIIRRSIDARKKPELFYVYTVMVEIADEAMVVKRAKNKNVMLAERITYQIPESGNETLEDRPVIVGAGPAGLFCAYLLTMQGYKPVLMERGKKVEDRKADVERFWETGMLDISSNVQFGEGGAGTFSDGKLNTVVKDPSGRNGFVLDTFVKFGAPEEIRYDAKPHIGTDILYQVIINIRNYLLENGCAIRYETCVTDIRIDNQKVVGVECGSDFIKSSVVILALGHSARDTFRMLNTKQIPMECKNFAVGFRVEHPQEMMDMHMYGQKRGKLPTAAYKVTSNFPNGRGVYSFCMCPGGYVVNASSQEGALVVNGMSYSGRNGANANSAIIVSVTEKDFGASDALAGMRYQEELERKAFSLCKGKIPQQLFGDYENNQCSNSYGDFESQAKGMAEFANLRGLLSEDMEESFCQGMHHFDRIIPGFARNDAIMSGIEARTSSPIRILRDENMESKIKGIYPCGEGAGYAGGITSAAIDGVKVAESIIRKYKGR